jgi:hypothetical protein
MREPAPRIRPPDARASRSPLRRPSSRRRRPHPPCHAPRSPPPPRRPCLTMAFSTAAAVTSGPFADRLLALLRGCVSASHLPLGLQIHARAVFSGALASYPALQTRLIGMYVLGAGSGTLSRCSPRSRAPPPPPRCPGTGSSAGSPRLAITASPCYSTSRYGATPPRRARTGTPSPTSSSLAQRSAQSPSAASCTAQRGRSGLAAMCTLGARSSKCKLMLAFSVIRARCSTQ